MTSHRSGKQGGMVLCRKLVFILRTMWNTEYHPPKGGSGVRTCVGEIILWTQGEMKDRSEGRKLTQEATVAPLVGAMEEVGVFDTHPCNPAHIQLGVLLRKIPTLVSFPYSNQTPMV